MPVSPVDIITYLGGTVRSPGGNTLRRILSRFAPRCRCVGDVAWYMGIGGRKWGIVSGGDSGTGGYVSSFTLAHTGSLYNRASAPTSKDRSSARYPAYLGIPSSSFPTLFPGPGPDPGVLAPAPDPTANNPTRSTSIGPGFSAGFHSILVPCLQH